MQHAVDKWRDQPLPVEGNLPLPQNVGPSDLKNGGGGGANVNSYTKNT